MPINTTPLGNGIEGLFLKNDRFSTTLISFNFYMPLDREKVSEYSLLPFIMTTCSQKYPDFSRLNYKLSKLYGATLEASTEKVGDLQVLKIGISTINDKYALDNEPLTEQACDMLLRLIFEPKTENEAFFDEDVEREKRKAIEHIRSEINDKRLYAKKRLMEEMYRNDVYGTPKCGTEMQIKALNGETLYNAWKKMLSQAFIRVNVISSSLPQALFTKISERFEEIERENITDCFSHTPTQHLNRVRRVTERMDIAQGKLALGFSCDMSGDDLNTAPLNVMSDIFGGGPYSRLFSNVREKLSLCYYCSAAPTRIKGNITVNCGIESENAVKAETEILNQLEIVRRGEFTDFEYESSIKNICDSLKSYNDSQGMLDYWYTIKVINKIQFTPEEYGELIAKVSREDVINVAKGVQLHTVYSLLPKEEEE